MTLEQMEAVIADVRAKLGSSARLALSGIGNLLIMDDSNECFGTIDMSDATITWFSEEGA